jgi:hypothetical protein
MQKARRHTFADAPTACRHMVSGSISLLSSRSFSPFPHGTGPLSVSGKYLALADGPAGFTQDFSCPALLRIPAERFRRFVYGILTLSDQTFQNVPLQRSRPLRPVLQPRPCRNRNGLGCSPFARHYSGNHFFVFFSCGY